MALLLAAVAAGPQAHLATEPSAPALATAGVPLPATHPATVHTAWLNGWMLNALEEHVLIVCAGSALIGQTVELWLDGDAVPRFVAIAQQSAAGAPGCAGDASASGERVALSINDYLALAGVESLQLRVADAPAVAPAIVATLIPAQ